MNSDWERKKVKINSLCANTLNLLAPFVFALDWDWLSTNWLVFTVTKNGKQCLERHILDGIDLFHSQYIKFAECREKIVFQHALLAHKGSQIMEQINCCATFAHSVSVEKSVCCSLQSSLVKHTVFILKVSASRCCTVTIKYGRSKIGNWGMQTVFGNN